jgi:ABC-type multidrug transport system fused ATPase/permease subunit
LDKNLTLTLTLPFNPYPLPTNPSQIGYVGQEPTLFSGSVSDNIARGRSGGGHCDLPTLQEVMVAEQKGRSCLASFFPIPKSVTLTSVVAESTVDTENDVEKGVTAGITGVPDDVINAAKQSYAHDFIKDFPQGYHTDVGEGSVMVSGTYVCTLSYIHIYIFVYLHINIYRGSKTKNSYCPSAYQAASRAFVR